MVTLQATESGISVARTYKVALAVGPLLSCVPRMSVVQ
jgi:hypothetical protein